MLKEKVIKTINRYNLIKPNDKIVCGVSGGPDSICMLDILRRIKEENKINFDIIVCHINHMIRKESTDDAKYVENLCEKMQIPFFKKDAEVEKVAKENKIGTEEQGRKMSFSMK